MLLKQIYSKQDLGFRWTQKDPTGPALQLGSCFYTCFFIMCSNGGVFGSLFGTPIINPPQSAILGMHGVFDRPVVRNGQVSYARAVFFMKIIILYRYYRNRILIQGYQDPDPGP